MHSLHTCKKRRWMRCGWKGLWSRQRTARSADDRRVRIRGMIPLGRRSDSGRVLISFVRSWGQQVVKLVGVLRRTPVKIEMSYEERFVRILVDGGDIAGFWFGNDMGKLLVIGDTEKSSSLIVEFL